MSANANMIVKETDEDIIDAKVDDTFLEEVLMESIPASIVIPPRVEVYEGMTLQELGEKLNRNLGNDVLAGKGEFIASECLNRGVDPYIVTAIMMHETGNGTSRIANSCYNFGGQKGSGCGGWKRYGSVDEGLKGMIDNLYNNYYAHGLTTVEAIGSKYAESGSWPSMINWYIGRIKAK